MHPLQFTFLYGTSGRGVCVCVCTGVHVCVYVTMCLIHAKQLMYYYMICFIAGIIYTPFTH